MKPDNVKVRDHDHRTGKYRGAAHNKCNINYYANRYIPVVMHNVRGYDGHLIINAAYKIMQTLDSKATISAIPNSNEKIMSINMGDLRHSFIILDFNNELFKLCKFPSIKFKDSTIFFFSLS